ncbi:MAG: penicillin-binding transpeptidase domain-containing protein [Candidatus Acidiferrales bacterium]
MEQRNRRLRWLVVWVLAVVWMAAVLFRLGYLQLFRYSEYLARADRQQERIFEISPMRGTIYDSKGRELAVSLPMDSVFADPSEITDVDTVADLLSRALNVSADDLAARIRGAHAPVRLARKLSPATVQRISDMNLRGVFFQKENRRVYPQRDLAASVVGYVDVDEKGIGGIEQSLDKEIRGRPGRMMVMADGHRRWYDRTESAADPGDSVTLTIDETIQYIAEKELARAMQETHAKHGTVVVQNPNNGNLLAVANWPKFDPNDPGAYSADARMDRAVTAAYEPGSIFKPLTMTGAIEHGVVSPNELIDCQMGKILVAGRVIHDWHPFGMLTVRQVLANSSEVGTIKVALRLGAPRFYRVIRQFGIGKLTGIDLPGESRGLLRPLDDWSATSIASIATGQEVGVTAIQIISAISAIANGGILYRPRIVKEIHGPHGPVRLHRGDPPRRVTDERTAAEVREMMEDVMIEGTGKHVQLDGYTSGGKTGTAQKIDPATGRYSRTNYIASFVGFAPVNDPAVTILVSLDSPVGEYYGDEVAGPVFKRIMEQVLAYLDVPRDVTMQSDLETASNKPLEKPDRASARSNASVARFEKAVAKSKVSGNSAPTAEFSDSTAVVMPNLAGQTIRGVMQECSRLGLAPSVIGDGIALQQFPDAGSQVPRGSQVTVLLGAPGTLAPTSMRQALN